MIEPKPAGRAWIAEFPGEKTTAGLVQPFRKRVQTFIGDLEGRGCRIRITATRRPRERAYLMHWAWQIARKRFPISKVPAFEPPIPITWTKAGAEEMVQAYRLVVLPALDSRHIQGRAVDMEILDFPGERPELEELGRSYGVIPLDGDPVHWSDDGH